MALDPNIALSYRGIEMPDPVAQYGQIAQIQNAQNQNALAKYQLSSAQRSDEQQNALYAAAKQPNFKLDFQSAIQYGAPGIAAYKAQQEAAGTALTQTKTQGDIDAQKVKAAMERVDAFSTALAPLVSSVQANKPITHSEVFAQANRLVSQGLLRHEDLATIPMNVAELPKFVMGMATSTENSRKALQTYLPEALVAGGNVINKNPLAVGGIGNVLGRVAMSDAQIEQNKVAQRNAEIAQRQADIAAGRLGVEQKRLAQDATSVVYQEDRNGNIVALPSRLKAGEVPTGRMAVAPGGGFQPMQAKPSEAVGKEQMSINQQRAIVKGALDAVAQTPDAFGYSAGLMPESARARMASSDENTNRSYLFNVVSGVIKERAGTAQSASEAQTLARFLPSETDNADIITDKLKGFDKYLTDKEKGTTKKRAGPTNTNLAPMDQQALQWANSNPADPRAAAIKQRLGQ